jgi:hypothetical protein
MAEGLGRERWAHTSLICSLIANANRDPKKQKPFKPDDFNPYSERHGATLDANVIQVNSATIGLLRAAFRSEGAQRTSPNERSRT